MVTSSWLPTGCTQLAFRVAAPSVLSNFSASLFEECDPELAKEAIPASLKLMEGFLKNDPGNKSILVSLSMGFAGYSLLFVEAEEPERASNLYLRSLNYGLQALDDRGVTLRNPTSGREEIQATLRKIEKGDYQALCWTTFSWNAWISLNLDKPEAIAQMAAAAACLKRVLEMDALYFHGLPQILMGVTLSARPPLLGGNPDQARFHFEAALKESDGKFFLAQVYFAKYYAVRAQDKTLFDRLLREVVAGDPEDFKEVCLINQVMQRKAKELQKQTSALFL